MTSFETGLLRRTAPRNDNQRRNHVLASALLLLALASDAAAQGATAAYPVKPIRMIVPFTPGGPADILARPIAQGLTERWGQQVLVDYRPGAGGNIGAEILAKSPPDGYTTMVITPGIIAVNPTLYAKVPFDTIRDFAGVTNAVTTANIMIVHPSLPVKSVKDLIQIARTRPGELTWKSALWAWSAHLKIGDTDRCGILGASL